MWCHKGRGAALVILVLATVFDLWVPPEK